MHVDGWVVDKVQERLSEQLQSRHLFHVAPYSASLLLALGADFTAVCQLLRATAVPAGTAESAY